MVNDSDKTSDWSSPAQHSHGEVLEEWQQQTETVGEEILALGGPLLSVKAYVLCQSHCILLGTRGRISPGSSLYCMGHLISEPV